MRKTFALLLSILMIISLTATHSVAMNKRDLIADISSKTGIDPADTSIALHSFFHVWIEILSKGDRVIIDGASMFARNGRIRFYPSNAVELRGWDYVNKKEIVGRMVEYGADLDAAQAVADNFIEITYGYLDNGDDLRIRKFGRFYRPIFRIRVRAMIPQTPRNVSIKKSAKFEPANYLLHRIR